MFTGIVERTGEITTAREVPGGRRLAVDAGPIARDCKLGSSVCISGVCLTVVRANGDTLEFDVIRETLLKSTLGSKRVGDQVNLERSLCVGDRLDGHFMQGHVEGTAIVDQVTASPQENVLRLRPAAELMPYIIPKGSVAVDGVSLTIAEVTRDSFSVALIPTTLERTSLSSLAVGDHVNIETDIIARTTVHRLSEMASTGGLTIDTLREAGFV